MRSNFRVEKETRRAGELSVMEKSVAEEQGIGVSGCVASCCVPLLPALCSYHCLLGSGFICLSNPAWTVTVTTSVTVIDSWFVSSLVVCFFFNLS